MTTVQDTCRPLLKEEDAFRIALAWQEPLQERARLVPSYLTNRIVRSYEWVTLLVKSGANLEDLLEQVHVFKAACTVWFALTCCRGYSGRENPSFWKRVFATLREPRRQPSDREQPVSEHHKEYENLVTDAVRFFAEDGLEFPRVQLFQADFGHLDRAKEAPLLRLFFYGTENPTVMMQATELQMKTLVDELLQYVEPSRSCRVIPTSLYSSSLFCFPRDAVGMYDLLATVPTTTSASTVLSAPLVTCEPAFVVTALVYGQDYVEEGEKLERLRRLFQTYSIDFTLVNFVAPMPINRRYNPAQYTQLLFGTDPSVQAGVKHGCHSLCGADDPHLVAYCSALPHTRSLEMLTLSGGTSVLSAYNCAWIGYALFHPNGETSCWSDLKLKISELTMENIETLENMAMGNNLRTIQSDQTSKVTAYHRADLQSGSVIRYEATSDAEVMLTTSEGVSVDVVLLSDDDASALPEWVGVIAPSYGLGWTLASNISQLRSRSPSVSSVKSLVLESKQTREEVLLRFLTLVGPTLRFLDIVGVQEFNADTVGRILQLCPFLESFRVCHDGAYWSGELNDHSTTPRLRELALCLPRDPELDMSRSSVSQLSGREYSALLERSRLPCPMTRYVAPSQSVAQTSLRHLRALRLEAHVSAEFNQSRSAIQRALGRLSGLEYLHFKVVQTASQKLAEPLSYSEERALSWDRLGFPDDQAGSRRRRGCLLSLLSVTRHPSARDSAVQRLNREVVELIVHFATSVLVDLCVENEGKEVKWRLSNTERMY